MPIPIGAVPTCEQGQAVARIGAEIPRAAQADRVQEEEREQERTVVRRRAMSGPLRADRTRGLQGKDQARVMGGGEE